MLYIEFRVWGMLNKFFYYRSFRVVLFYFIFFRVLIKLFKLVLNEFCGLGGFWISDFFVIVVWVVRVVVFDY